MRQDTSQKAELAESNLKERIFNISNILPVILIIEIIYIVFVNLFKNTAYPEFDMAKLYRHAIEMVNNHSIVIDGWNYITTMELDCSLLFALPLYALTKNIYLSFGISNIIFVFIYLFVFHDIARKMNVKAVYKFIPAILLLIPYRIGMLEYFNMMFYNGGQYVVKVLVPLILIDLMLEEDNAQWNMKNVLLTVLFALLMMVTSLSSGTYVLLSGVFPIVVAYAMNLVIGGDLKKININKIILIVISFASFVAGYILCKVLSVSPNSEGMGLVPPRRFIDNLLLTIWGYISIFVEPVDPGVISARGIEQLIRYAFVIVVTVVTIWGIRGIFETGEESDKKRILALPFIFTIIILCFTQVCFSDVYYPERYFLIGIIPMFFLVPYYIENLDGKLCNKLFNNVVYILATGLVVLMFLAGTRGVKRGFIFGYDEGYDQVKDVISYAKENNIDNIFWLYNLPDGEVARLFDTDIKSTVINFDEDGKPFLDPLRDYYLKANDAAYYAGANMLVDKNGSGNFDRLPDYVKSSYREVGTVAWYTIYISDPNKLDGDVGYPVSGVDESLDFCYSRGYQYFGEIDAYGYLNVVGNNDYNLVSPLFTASVDNMEVCISYEGENDETDILGRLVLLNESFEVVDEILMSNGVGTIESSILAPAGGQYFIGIVINEGEACKIHNIVYKRK